MEVEMKTTQALFASYAFEKKQSVIQIEKLEEQLELAEKKERDYINNQQTRTVNTTKAQAPAPQMLNGI